MFNSQNFAYMSFIILEGNLGEKVSLSWLTSLSWAEGEVKMYRMYREIQNLDQKFSLKLLQNFSFSESSRMTPVTEHLCDILETSVTGPKVYRLIFFFWDHGGVQLSWEPVHMIYL